MKNLILSLLLIFLFISCSNLMEDINNAVPYKFRKIYPENANIDSYFGSSMAISGNYLIIGAYGDNDNKGAVYIYRFVNAEWTSMGKFAPDDLASGDRFGFSVSIFSSESLSYAVIGAPLDNNATEEDNGTAYIYKLDGDHWIKKAKFTDTNPAQWDGHDEFGYSVAVNENSAIIGAWQNESNAGSIYTYEDGGSDFLGGTGSEIGFGNGVSTAGDRFGAALGITDTYAIIGMSGNNDKGSGSGSAYIYKYNTGTWSQLPPILNASDGASNDRFGSAVALSNDYAMIGSIYDSDLSDSCGALYIFKNTADVWNETQKIVPGNLEANDEFGRIIALNNNLLALGVPSKDSKGKDSGSVYVYKLNGSLWEKITMIIPADGGELDYFGSSVAVNNEYIFVGAQQDDDSGENFGAVYIYEQ